MRSEPIQPTPELPPGARTQPAQCETHGDYDQKVFPVLGRELKSGCPECGRIIQEKAEAAQQANKAMELRMSMERKLGAALIPKRFASKTLDGYVATTAEQRKALNTCRRYAAEFSEIAESGRCLLLLGKPGTGKTHLSVAIANEIMAKSSATAVYRTIGAVLQAIRATYDHSIDQSESQILSSLISPSLLILDEIGVSKEKPSDFELTTLFAIINGRYEELRPTVIVSNLDGQSLPAAIGERCIDRLREGGVIVIPFEWESQRGKEGF
ncbi:ATP-binding protein [Pseudomonas poae]|uniref:Phage DNA replication protein (Predicted replicative helicase loader) n=1 Tax=Pseudomonas poae TaxID=200451 RepID=A0ABY0RBF6_9PSED|nr:ATP-binding protein [Pseudomonas poae]KRP44085.1 ATP-binding protein [Pseudomonas poae]SDN51195.1 phage DNA replication protein (predicted replicative helicase loader) [Pseudomonas poae]